VENHKSHECKNYIVQRLVSQKDPPHLRLEKRVCLQFVQFHQLGMVSLNRGMIRKLLEENFFFVNTPGGFYRRNMWIDFNQMETYAQLW